MLTSGSTDLTLEQWAALWNNLSGPNGPIICTTTSTVQNLKSALESLCSWNPSECTTDVQTQINNFMGEVSSVQSKK